MTKDGVSLPEVSMAPVAEPSAAGTELVRFWNESRLRADQAKSTSVRSAPKIVPWRAALEDVLKVGYGVENQSRYIAGSWQRVRRLTTPSAGALYPFEVFAAVVGEGSYLWDVDKARLVPCGLEPMAHEDLAAAGFTAPPGQRLEALLILVARPWLSMKKYYQRGYAYCHLDVGHLATNLAIYTAALGHDSTLHLRFSHAALAEHLKLGGLCREPLAVLSFAAARPAACPEPAAGPAALAGVEAAALELPGELELALLGVAARHPLLRLPGRAPLSGRQRAAPGRAGRGPRGSRPAAPDRPGAALRGAGMAGGDPRPPLGQGLPRRAAERRAHRRAARRAAGRGLPLGLLRGRLGAARRAPGGQERRRSRRRLRLRAAGATPCTGSPSGRTTPGRPACTRRSPATRRPW